MRSAIVSRCHTLHEKTLSRIQHPRDGSSPRYAHRCRRRLNRHHRRILHPDDKYLRRIVGTPRLERLYNIVVAERRSRQNKRDIKRCRQEIARVDRNSVCCRDMDSLALYATRLVIIAVRRIDTDDNARACRHRKTLTPARIRIAYRPRTSTDACYRHTHLRLYPTLHEREPKVCSHRRTSLTPPSHQRQHQQHNDRYYTTISIIPIHKHNSTNGFSPFHNCTIFFAIKRSSLSTTSVIYPFGKTMKVNGTATHKAPPRLALVPSIRLLSTIWLPTTSVYT